MKTYFFGCRLEGVQTGKGGDWVGSRVGVLLCVDFWFKIRCCFSIYLIDFQLFKTNKFVLELAFLWLEVYTLAATNFL